MRRTPIILTCIALSTLAAHRPACAQEIDESKVVRLKAAFIYNLMKFTHWPDSAFDEPTTPFTIALLGESPVVPVFLAATRDRTVGKRAIRALHLSYPAPPPHRRAANGAAMAAYRARVEALHRQLEQCHVVYVSPDAFGYWPEVRQTLQQRATLTISDTPSFCRHRGMVELALDANQERLRILLNRGSVDATELRLQAQLLSVVSIVHSEPQSEDTTNGQEDQP
jgi:hypothetical protein